MVVRSDALRDMAKVAATASHLLPKLGFSSPHYLQLNPTIKFPTTSFRGSTRVQASNPKREEQDSSINNNTSQSFISEEDLKYLVKLGGGSVVGAAVMKYGSIILPEITRPNIIQALIMVWAPVVVAVWLLLKQSRQD